MSIPFVIIHHFILRLCQTAYHQFSLALIVILWLIVVLSEEALDLIRLKPRSSEGFSILVDLWRGYTPIKLECGLFVSLVSSPDLIDSPDAHVGVLPCEVTVRDVISFNGLLQISES